MMVVTLGQQYNVGEKPTVIMYTYMKSACRDTRQPSKTKQKQCSISLYMVVIIYCYILVGYKDKVTTTWYMVFKRVVTNENQYFGIRNLEI